MTAQCNPNQLACAKRAAAPGPDFCGECGLTRNEFAPGPSNTALHPKSTTSVKPPPPLSSRPILQMKPLNHSVSPTVLSQPRAAPQTQPVPQHPVSTQQTSASSPGSPHQPKRRRYRTLIGVLVGVAIIAAAAVVVVQTDLVDRLANTRSQTTKITGTVSDELMALSRDSSPEVRLGSETVKVGNDGFSSVGAADHTGLATLMVGDEILGSNLVPKSDSLIISSLQVSLESTALSMVLLRPEIADVYVVGNPILDAAAQELLLRSAELQAVVDALRAEKNLEGVTYLREISPETQERVGLAADWFRWTVSQDTATSVNLAARPSRETSNIRPETELRVEGLPQTCDEGLMPSSTGEADGLCFEVISPKRADWETYTFDGALEVAIKNLSPRAAALFHDSNASGLRFIGLVPPLDLTLPSVGEILWKVFESPTQYFQLAPNASTSNSADSRTTFIVDNVSELSKITTVSFDYPGFPGVTNSEFDELVDGSDLKTGRAISVGLTALSTYLLPLFAVLLDSKKWTTKNTQSGFLSECPATVITDLAESATELLLNDDNSLSGSETLFDLLLNSEGTIPYLFWLSLADLMGQDCESAMNDTKIVTACFPTLRSFIDAMRSPPASSPQLDQCGSEIFDQLLEELAFGALRGLVNPLAKANTGIVLLGSARALAWSLRDAKRFADGDQYEISTIRLPRWCYEVAAFNTRMLGVFNKLEIDKSGNFIKDFREIVQGFLMLTTQLVEVGGNLTNESNWEREAKIWLEIAEISPIKVQPGAQRAAEVSSRISKIIPELVDAARLSASVVASENDIQRAKDVVSLALKVKAIQGDFTRLLSEIEQGGPDFERLDTQWNDVCPQSAGSS